MKISIIIPFYNESGNLKNLFFEIRDALKNKFFYEIIFINDGSIDNGQTELSTILRETNNTFLINHRKRFGKGKALKTGFEKSNGDIIVFLDADLQNNPQDIPSLVDKVFQGYDFVNGWRKNRLDQKDKTLPSSIFNRILKFTFKSKFSDINCGLKVMKRQVLEDIPLYGDNYRFLPILAEKEGFKTMELPVDHRKRLVGKSKYGTIRLFFGLIDTLTTYFIYRFSEKPLHFFGSVGGIFLIFGLGISIYLSIERIFFGELLYKRPLLLFAILLIIVGIQIINTGIIGELIVYLRQKRDQSYKKKFNYKHLKVNHYNKNVKYKK